MIRTTHVSVDIRSIRSSISYVTSEGFSGNIDRATLRANIGKLNALKQNYMIELNRSELPA